MFEIEKSYRKSVATPTFIKQLQKRTYFVPLPARVLQKSVGMHSLLVHIHW